MLKDFFFKFSEAEGCDDKKSNACDIVGNLNRRVDRMDLRHNTNKEKIFNGLFELKETKDDCDYCGITDGLQIGLAEKWSRNKLNLKPRDDDCKNEK